MPSMSPNAYRLLGFAVWRGGRWYLRRRLPSKRTLALTTAAAGVALSAAGMIARRVNNVPGKHD
jgi:hypothetical protein